MNTVYAVVIFSYVVLILLEIAFGFLRLRRDLFAGFALSGIISSNATLNGEDATSVKQRARLAYIMADAMLRAREEHAK